MLTPEKYLEDFPDNHYYRDLKDELKSYHTALIQSIIDDLEANRNKNAVEYLKSKL